MTLIHQVSKQFIYQKFKKLTLAMTLNIHNWLTNTEATANYLHSMRMTHYVLALQSLQSQQQTNQSKQIQNSLATSFGLNGIHNDTLVLEENLQPSSH